MMDKADQKLMKQIPVSSGAGRSSRLDGRNKVIASSRVATHRRNHVKLRNGIECLVRPRVVGDSICITRNPNFKFGCFLIGTRHLHRNHNIRVVMMNRVQLEGKAMNLRVQEMCKDIPELKELF